MMIVINRCEQEVRSLQVHHGEGSASRVSGNLFMPAPPNNLILSLA